MTILVEYQKKEKSKIYNSTIRLTQSHKSSCDIP